MWTNLSELEEFGKCKNISKFYHKKHLLACFAVFRHVNAVSVEQKGMKKDKDDAKTL